VTTSSSSEANAVGVRRDRGVGLTAPAAAARPRHVAGFPAPTDPTPDHLSGSALRTTRSKLECDNDGFAGDDLLVTTAQNIQTHPLQQQQPATPKVADSQTHCVSVELHSAPRQLAGTDAGNEWKI